MKKERNPMQSLIEKIKKSNIHLIPLTNKVTVKEINMVEAVKVEDRNQENYKPSQL